MFYVLKIALGVCVLIAIHKFGHFAASQILGLNKQSARKNPAQLVVVALSGPLMNFAAALILVLFSLMYQEFKLGNITAGSFFPLLQVSLTNSIFIIGTLFSKTFSIILGGHAAHAFILGPVGLLDYLGHIHSFVNFLLALATLSFGLGLVCLIPIPPADGGKIILILIESVQPLSISVKRTISIVGAVLLLSIALIPDFKYFF